MTDEIEQLLRNLHLKKIAAIIDDELAHAEKHQLSYGAFLARLLRAQYHHRQETALAWRIKQARLPETWTIESFPFKRQPGVNAKQIRALADLEFVAKAENIVFIGPTGVGKTGLASGLLLKAIQNGYRGALHPGAGSLRRDVCLARRPLDAAAAQRADPHRRLAHRRAGVPQSQARTDQHLLQADGGTLPPQARRLSPRTWTTPSGKRFSATKRSSTRSSVASAISATPSASTAPPCAIPKADPNASAGASSPAPHLPRFLETTKPRHLDSARDC